MDSFTVAELGAWLVSLIVPTGALIGMTVAVARWVWPKVRASIIGEIRSQVDEAIGPVRSEVTHNAGASLKDQVCRTAREIQELNRRLEAVGGHIDDLSSLPARIAELASRLDAHIDRGDRRRKWYRP